jgi:hypothetical protein
MTIFWRTFLITITTCNITVPRPDCSGTNPSGNEGIHYHAYVILLTTITRNNDRVYLKWLSINEIMLNIDGLMLCKISSGCLATMPQMEKQKKTAETVVKREIQKGP